MGPRRLRGRGLHGGGHAAGVLLGHRDHGQGLLGPVADVLEHALHGAGDLGVRGLDHVAAGHRDAGALGQVLGRDGTIPAGGLARGGQRVQGAVIGERGEQAHQAPLEGRCTVRSGRVGSTSSSASWAERSGRRGPAVAVGSTETWNDCGRPITGSPRATTWGARVSAPIAVARAVASASSSTTTSARHSGELGQGHGRGGDHRHERLQELG